jgi:cytochrome P450
MDAGHVMTSDGTPLEELDMPCFDFSDPATARDPFTAARTLLGAGHWIARTPSGYVVLTWQDCDNLNRDPRFRTPPGLGLSAQGITSGRGFEWASQTVPSLDPATHKRVRRLTNPAFSRARLEDRRAHAHGLMEDIITPVAGRGRAEAAQICRSYSVRMICNLLQWPDEDWQKIDRWADAANQLIGPAISDGRLAWIEDNLAEMRAYTLSNLKRLRGREGGDLGSLIMATAERGDQLNETEMVALFESLLAAGADTTKAALTTALYLFARHPDQWQELADDRSLVPSAVDELLRYRPITFSASRQALLDLLYRDARISEGTLLLLTQGSANFDAGAYDDPHSFDIHRYVDGRRTPRPPHLTFGYGIHVCLGQHLARLELQEALTVLPPGLKNLRIDGTDSRGVEWGPFLGPHSPTWLPLAWDPS